MLNNLIRDNGYKCDVGACAPVVVGDNDIPIDIQQALIAISQEAVDLTSRMVRHQNFEGITEQAVSALQHEVTREWRYSLAPVIDSYFPENIGEMLVSQKELLDKHLFDDQVRQKMAAGYSGEYAYLLKSMR